MSEQSQAKTLNKTPRKLRAVAVSGVFFVVILVLAGWFVRSRWDEFSQIEVADWRWLALLAALFVARMTLRGVFQWQAMRALGASITFRDAMALCYTGLMLNTVLPMPVGAGYRAMYMRRVHGLSLSYFAGTMAMLFFAGLLVSSMLGLGGAVWVSSQGGEISAIVYAVLGAITLGSVLAIAVPWRAEGYGPIARRLSKLADGWRTLTRSPSLLAGASGVVIVSAAINVVAMSSAFAAFGTPLDLSGAFLLMASQQVGGMIRLTPGAIGYQEMVSAYVASMLTVTMVQAVIALAASRLVNIGVSLLLGLPAFAIVSAKSAGGSESEQRPNHDETKP